MFPILLLGWLNGARANAVLDYGCQGKNPVDNIFHEMFYKVFLSILLGIKSFC